MEVPVETLIAAIGQGYVLTTPLQLAVMTARIASGGKKILPSIIKSSEEKNFDIMQKYSNAIKIVQKALFKVVNEKKGTANRSKSDDFYFSGKTVIAPSPPPPPRPPPAARRAAAAASRAV